MVAPPKVEKEVAVEHNTDKGGPDKHMKAVETRGDVKRPTVHPVGEGEGGQDVFYTLQRCEVRSEGHCDH